jgi:uncharacterized protein DUF429
MLFQDSVFVGVDPTSGHKACTYAALDRDLNLMALADAEMEDAVAFLGGQKSVIVAVNAPSNVNRGLVRKNLEKQSLAPQHLRGVDIRLAEYELRERGIAVGGTAARESLCPAWVQMGFEFYKRLSNSGFRPYSADGVSHQWLETHPHACFCALLGGSPLPKPTLEGRLQRELILYERGVQIRDPMDFFEEITRHRLRMGVLPMELVHPSEQLDALVAAYTAWLAAEKPDEVSRLGHKLEGFITLPVSSLKEKY